MEDDKKKEEELKKKELLEKIMNYLTHLKIILKMKF